MGIFGNLVTYTYNKGGWVTRGQEKIVRNACQSPPCPVTFALFFPMPLEALLS